MLKLIASNEASPYVLARIQIRIREYGLTGLVFIEETLPDRGAASKPHAIETGFRPLIGFADRGHLKVCALNNANSDKDRTRVSNGLVAFAELRFDILRHGKGGLLLGGEAA